MNLPLHNDSTDAPSQTELLASYAEVCRGTLIERLGIELTHIAADVTSGTMPVAGNTQPAGLLHGGANVALAESLGSLAASVHAGPGRNVVGIEVSATHHRAVREGFVTGTATAIHLGRTTATYEIVIVDDAGKRVCTARLTCLVLAGK